MRQEIHGISVFNFRSSGTALISIHVKGERPENSVGRLQSDFTMILSEDALYDLISVIENALAESRLETAKMASQGESHATN